MPIPAAAAGGAHPHAHPLYLLTHRGRRQCRRCHRCHLLSFLNYNMGCNQQMPVLLPSTKQPRHSGAFRGGEGWGVVGKNNCISNEFLGFQSLLRFDKWFIWRTVWAWRGKEGGRLAGLTLGWKLDFYSSFHRQSFERTMIILLFGFSFWPWEAADFKKDQSSPHKPPAAISGSLNKSSTASSFSFSVSEMERYFYPFF